MKLLENKVALITGASSGIGAVTAEVFAKHGASVAILARRQNVLEQKAEEIRALGVPCLPIAADVTDPDSCATAIQQAVDKFGRLDILVNNAGAGDFHTPTVKCSDEFWNKMIALNQTSVFYLCRAVLPQIERVSLFEHFYRKATPVFPANRCNKRVSPSCT